MTTCTSSSGITVSGTYRRIGGFHGSVSGLSGTIANISMTLNSLNVTNLNSVAMVLVPPSGSGLTPLDFFSGICGVDRGGNSHFHPCQYWRESVKTTQRYGTLSWAAAHVPARFQVHTCLPTTSLPRRYLQLTRPFNLQFCRNRRQHYAPAQRSSCGSFNFSSFGTSGSAMNGTWTMYIANQSPSGFTPAGSLGFWSISFTGSCSTATTTSISASPNGSSSLVFTSSNVHGDATTPTSVTLTATVSPNPGGGTVTFYDSTGTSAGSGPMLASGVAVNGAGTGTGSPCLFRVPRRVLAAFPRHSMDLPVSWEAHHRPQWY